MITVAILGPVEILREGAAHAVRPGKTTELLVRLALEAGEVVRTERLIEDLWGDDGGSARRNTLQTKASSLRRSLGGVGTVKGSEAGYALMIPRNEIDAFVVLALASEVADRRAVATWRDPPRRARGPSRCSVATSSAAPATAPGPSRIGRGTAKCN